MPECPVITGAGGKSPARANEVRHLNQYTGYFTTPEGDFPVSVVANSIKEAAKILTMPGVFGDDVNEPSIIKFIKGKVAVSVPVRKTGFNVVIEPKGAIDSGAYATPVRADVENGTEVIFTAFEPFGWKFIGWYKGDQLISTEKQAVIDVYDPYSSYIEYTAKYEFDPIMRNGRYLELGKGWLVDFKFDGYSNYLGRMIINSTYVPDWYFVITGMTEDTITFQNDPTINQPSEIEGTFKYVATPIGLNLVVQAITIENPFGLMVDSVLTLKWTSEFDHFPHTIAPPVNPLP